eukprot:GILI01026624.1.p1 GENE.GILI01026624.1~~GILI01026624.1.p1  ORF type:complete len:109 (+),score=7.89 GILI01026624.1:45-371(+)
MKRRLRASGVGSKRPSEDDSSTLSDIPTKLRIMQSVAESLGRNITALMESQAKFKTLLDENLAMNLQMRSTLEALEALIARYEESLALQPPSSNFFGTAPPSSSSALE